MRLALFAIAIAIAILLQTVSAATANRKLRMCCRKSPEADKECRRRFCNFDFLHQGSVFPFLAMCVNRGDTVSKMWDCVSSRADHTACCAANGVIQHCMPYCNTVDKVPTDFAKYGICIGQFNQIRDCFRGYLERNPNLKGDQ
uniref:DB domain-containing protein n=1 Tax=Ascaris lumbricoides TaxID=6252 RepID=A0A0M3I9E9_ASCLU